jgi:hypothetical protein
MARIYPKRSRKKFGDPAPSGAAELAARQEVVDLVDRQPDLWPFLNQLTLAPPVNWTVTLWRLRSVENKYRSAA